MLLGEFRSEVTIRANLHIYRDSLQCVAKQINIQREHLNLFLLTYSSLFLALLFFSTLYFSKDVFLVPI